MSGGLAGFLYHQQKESTSLKNIPVATRILLPELIFDAFLCQVCFRVFRILGCFLRGLKYQGLSEATHGALA